MSSDKPWSRWRGRTRAWWPSPPPCPKGPGLDRFARRFPDRFFDVGIAESSRGHHGGRPGGRRAPPGRGGLLHFSPAGLRPDSTRCLPAEPAGDFRPGPGGGWSGRTARRIMASLIWHISGTSRGSRSWRPKDERELRRMLRTALAAGLPVAIRYPRAPGLDLPLEEEPSRPPLGARRTDQTRSRRGLDRLGSDGRRGRGRGGPPVRPGHLLLRGQRQVCQACWTRTSSWIWPSEPSAW